MANRRMISSEIFLDDWFGSLNNFERILWIGLFTACADDQGRFQFMPAAIRAQVFPYDDVSLNDVQIALNAFMAAGKIVCYQPEGSQRYYAQIVKWWEYQKPSWAMPSKTPAPAGWIDRAKYHLNPSKVITLNWEKCGGYQEGKPIQDLLPNTLPNTLPRGIDEIRGDELRRDEMRGEEGKKTAAAAASDAPLFETPPAYINAGSLVMPILSRACGLVALPPSENARIDQLTSLIQHYGTGPVEAALKQAYLTWTGTTRKDGNGTYRPTNLGWVDKAQDELMKNNGVGGIDWDTVDPQTLYGKDLDTWAQHRLEKLQNK